MENVELFPIDEGIEVPPIQRRKAKTSKLMATLSALKPKKSFFVPGMDVKRVSPEIAKIKRSLHASFTTRTWEEKVNGKNVKGVRIWRDPNTIVNKRQQPKSQH